MHARTPSTGYVFGRYYDPATGQFISVDPLVDETGQPYAYVNGDPVNGLDPNGLGVISSIENTAIGAAQCIGDLQQCLSPHGAANAATSALNAVWSFATNGQAGPGLPSPYPCDPYLSESNAFGQAAFGAGLALLGGEADFGAAGIGSSAGAEAAAAADAGLVERVITSLSAGRSPGVYTVSNSDELRGLYDNLSVGGSSVETSYPGAIVRLPDGTTVAIRTGSKSGGPTIDVKLPDGTQLKVHVSQ